ncbi:hypothetical protein [Streptomyces drozdowiczii]|uniref:Uncharacterized protein n=1 Tax=Streptomyces drozdowiczii TaxID=202862 RepID=A0ABY6PL10_9ACTN|nr:hypothetical protein [Streptomyces drozdowiczii]MCX0241909.1 hypothetical protein [Streptomyces drozdowiczii]MCX0247903.1 hypothetical protein [Streptomyces drozdowiczii]UZK52737.1 hypothetical protein NEH16_00160 [Streptomyces drozdowiczii]UZK57979.1 hypothetical protein NEH16_31305 [Streptomyces drozdowiczii]
MYLSRLRTILAFGGQPLWFEARDDFTDFFVTVACPHCDAPVTTAIGDYGCYSSICEMLHETAVRDGQQRLAWGLKHLFDQAECPGRGSVFGIAGEYAAASAPAPWDFARGRTKDTL